MCGIAGICHASKDTRVDRELLVKMGDALTHRGPDDWGILTKSNIGLYHRRLSIIDIHAGKQPIFNETGEIGIVFNGEIYNFKELRHNLLGRGHKFSTDTDTEVIIHAYEEYGYKCLDHFSGMFAFAIWDGRDNSVFIARDRMGKKPLFYQHTHGDLYFSSELKSLMHAPVVSKQINYHALTSYLYFKYIPENTSILQNVEKLLPGHYMVWKNGTLSVKRYWSVTFPSGSEVITDEKEWTNKLDSILREATKIRLRSDVPLGIFLSGGVDSSCITALAAQESDNQVSTYSVGFEEGDFNELEYAKIVADHFQTNHTELIIQKESAGILEDIAYFLDEPFADSSALPTMLICREARKHVTVCLSGDGGDELFSGYSRYLTALKLAKRSKYVPAPLKKILLKPLLDILPRYTTGYGEIERYSISDDLERYIFTMQSFTEKDLKLLDNNNKLPLEYNYLQDLSGKYNIHNDQDMITQFQHLDQISYLVSDILVKVDRMSMMNSLEVRSPLLDNNVVEFINSAPSSLKQRGNTGKYILKNVVSRYLPDEIIKRRKQGFGLPIKHWFRNDLKELLSDQLLVNSNLSDYFSIKEIENLVNAHNKGYRDFSERLWVLLMFSLWLKAYNI